MNRRWAWLTWTATMLAGGIFAEEDWPRFRGPNGSGVSDTTGLPVEFGPAKNLLWKTAVPFSRSSPIIAGKRIFLTAVEGEKLITLCLDRSTGRIQWRREIVRPRAMPIYKANDGASPTPVSDGTSVYAFFPDLGLVSFGPDGNERWRLPLGPYDTFYGLAASPILAGDTLLLVCDARKKPFLIAVDAGSGKTRWRVERTDTRYEGYTSPIIYEPEGGRAQVIVLGAHRIDAYKVATGERQWWIRGLGYFPVGSPALGKGVVVASTYGSDTPAGPTFDEFLKKLDSNHDGRLSPEELRAEKEMADQFGAFDYNSDGFIDRDEWDLMRNGAVGKYGLVGVRLGGRGDLTQTAVAWHEKKTYPSVTSPLIYQNVLYVIKTGGIIGSMDPVTGEIFKIDRTKDAIEDYYSSPVAADGKVIFVSENGKVTVLKSGRQWEVLAVNDLGEECQTTPAIAGGKIFTRTRSALYCFGKK